MPMPSKTLMRIIKRDIKGTDGSQRIKVLREHLDNLPGYYQGPYGKLRKWIKDEIESTQQKQKVRTKDRFFVAKEGDCQVALLGLPSAGKSSLLRSLTGRQVKVGAYPFTTLQPTAALMKVNGALLQLVEIPGLFEGASRGVAKGISLLAAARVADQIVWVVSLALGGADTLILREETEAAGLKAPRLIVATHADHPDASNAMEEIGAVMPGIAIVTCSNLTKVGMDDVRQELWKASGLMRIYLKRPNARYHTSEPMSLPSGATVQDLATKIHKDIARSFQSARIWGHSAIFPRQNVGLDHVLADGDIVEISTR